MVPRAARASLRAGFANVIGTMPVQPVAAKTWGYNTPFFWEDFNSLSRSVDINNTLLPGYSFYPHWYNYGTTSQWNTWPSSCFTVNNSVLTFSPTNLRDSSGRSGGSIVSAAYLDNGAPVPYVGTLIQPGGFYVETRVQFGASPGLSNNWFPSFWAWDGDIFVNNSPNSSYGANRYSELDVFEFDGSSFDRQVFDYSQANGRNAVGSTNFGLTVSNPNSWHNWGMLCVPPSLNAGTGLIQTYIDGVHSPGNDVTYSSSTISSQAGTGATTGWMGGLDVSTLGLTIQIQTGYQWPINVDWVVGWRRGP